MKVTQSNEVKEKKEDLLIVARAKKRTSSFLFPHSSSDIKRESITILNSIIEILYCMFCSIDRSIFSRD